MTMKQKVISGSPSNTQTNSLKNLSSTARGMLCQFSIPATASFSLFIVHVAHADFRSSFSSYLPTSQEVLFALKCQSNPESNKFSCISKGYLFLFTLKS